MNNLPKIPSEFIEPYLQQMIVIELECLAFRPTQERLDEAKQNLRGVERFISRFGGLHSTFAVSNEYEKFYKLTLEDVKEIIKH